MKKFLIALALAALILLPITSFAADCANIGTTYITQRLANVRVTMTASASDATFTSCTVPMQGLLLDAIADGASPAPTDNWDFTLTQESRDVLGGYGANMDTTTETSLKDAGFTYQIVNGRYTLAISNNSVNSAVIYFNFYVMK